MDCNECKEHNKKTLCTVSYVDYQGNLHREIKRARCWMFAFLIALCMLISTNTWWYVYHSQDNAISEQEGVTYETETSVLCSLE